MYVIYKIVQLIHIKIELVIDYNKTIQIFFS